MLVSWAVRRPSDRVLDPACGDGVFLVASAERLKSLRGKPAAQIFGIEIDRSVYQKSLAHLLGRIGAPKENVLVSDFFDVRPSTLGKFEAVVGNPPFIRYQTFKGASRAKALLAAHTAGVRLSELASSWAPFLVHATEFLVPGGRLAMVVPAEITHAGYAKPVIQFLTQRFQNLSIASFTERLFPELSQDTLLIFADGLGGKSKQIRLKRFQCISELETQFRLRPTFGTGVSTRILESTNGRLRDHFLPPELRMLYDRLAGSPKICRLGDLADVGIGYVTGANDFFHLSEQEVDRFQIPRTYLKPALLRGGIIRGLKVSRHDWAELRTQGDKVYLLSLPRTPETMFPEGVRQYLREGKRQAVHEAYKCAVRKPWYSVPHSSPSDAFMTYMSGGAPRITWNEGRLLATNSLHEIRLRNPRAHDPRKIALGFCSSLSQLSGEIEGHPMGGGMLKLEPSEAERVLVVRPEAIVAGKGAFDELDLLIRSGDTDAALDFADELILRNHLALTWDQIRLVRDGAKEITDSRRKKLAPPSSD